MYLNIENIKYINNNNGCNQFFWTVTWISSCSSTNRGSSSQRTSCFQLRCGLLGSLVTWCPPNPLTTRGRSRTTCHGDGFWSWPPSYGAMAWAIWSIWADGGGFQILQQLPMFSLIQLGLHLGWICDDLWRGTVVGLGAAKCRAQDLSRRTI